MKLIFILISLFIFCNVNSQKQYDTLTTENGEKIYSKRNGEFKHVIRYNNKLNSKWVFDYTIVEGKWVKLGFSRFYMNDILNTIEYSIDSITDVEEFYNDGKIKERYSLLNCLLNGHYLGFYNNGLLSTRGIYKRGLREGKWSFWSKSGELEQSGHFLIKAISEDEIENYIKYIDNWNGSSISYKKGLWLETINGKVITKKY